ncbi:glycosyltransferase [Pseudomonas helleri]|uniref:glycosyltransferase family 2 protein n=1 Tax=Pseudomonas helleri TaxID=1608996 RepID=UPI001297A9D0|nr:glycosyltransferase family 2 protein [Pseudomonas helleri]MQU61386.1 glycosyltransferase [Pseudomonas helleri]
MKISVVTISFNQVGYLKQCIDSVLDQDYNDIEYIIVDPGSTDGSRELIESYGDRIIKIFEPDSGPANGLNNGFRIATGDIFYFINSDDYVYPGAFKYAANIFKNSKKIDVLLAAGHRVDAQGKINKTLYPSSISKYSYVYGAVTLFQQGMFFSSRAFKQVGGFNEANRTCWDGELLLDFMTSAASFKRSMKKVGAFRIYPESITGSQRFAEKYKTDKERLFKSVYGKNHKKRTIISYYYRAFKIIGDPLYTVKHLLGNSL